MRGGYRPPRSRVGIIILHAAAGCKIIDRYFLILRLSSENEPSLYLYTKISLLSYSISAKVTDIYI